MNVTNGIYRAAQIIFGSGLASVFLLASNIVAARALAPVAYGDYITAFTLINGGMFIAVFGVTQLLLQEYGRKQSFSPSFARSIIVVQLTTTIAACVAIASLVFLISLSYQARILTLLLLPILVAQATGDIASVYFQLTENRWLTGGWIALLNFIRFVSSLLFVWTTHNIYMLVIYQSVAGTAFSVASIFLMLRMFARYSSPQDRDDRMSLWHALRQVLGASSPYAISSLMYFAIAQLPLILFAATIGSRQTAIFGVAFLIISTFYFVPQTLMVRYLLLKYHAIATTDRKTLSFLYLQGSRWAAGAGVAMVFPAYFLIPEIVTLVFGHKYDESIRLVRIMMICIPLRFVTVNLAAIVVSGVSIWHKNFADLASGGFAIVCYLVFISINPVTGGAYAAVLTEIVVLGTHYYLIKRYLHGLSLSQWARDFLPW